MTHTSKHTLTIKSFLFLVVIVGGGLVLWNEHRNYLFEYLPYLILLLCPFMHFFMHRGQGSHKLFTPGFGF